MKTSDIKVGEAYAVGTSREHGQKRAVVVDTSAEEPVMGYGRRFMTKKGIRVKWDDPAPWMDESGTSVVSPREVQEPWEEFAVRRARIDAQRREAYEQKRARREHAERLAENLRGLGCDAYARAIERIEISVADAERIANVLSDAEGGMMGDLAHGPRSAEALDGAMHSVWLHGDWRWLSMKMTTEEKEAAADAVDRHGAKIDPEDPTKVDRWWLRANGCPWD